MKPKVSLTEMSAAWDMASGSVISEIVAYVNRVTGAVVTSMDAEFSDEEMADFSEHEDYVAMPDKYALDLGTALVWRFVDREIPGLRPRVQEIFSRRGAYRRYKDFLADVGLLDEWHTFEDQAVNEALTQWAVDEGFEVVD